jgi:hypothetical protein
VGFGPSSCGEETEHEDAKETGSPKENAAGDGCACILPSVLRIFVLSGFRDSFIHLAASTPALLAAYHFLASVLSG